MNTHDLRPLTSTKALFHKHESKVRSYARNFPSLFSRAEGSYLFDEQGRGYLDFLSGAGSLNYGHNHKLLREALVRYINAGGVAHSLDLHTTAKAEFLEKLENLILMVFTA
jgi:diaminobutyrate-2-oxoglutarate transaminase